MIRYIPQWAMAMALVTPIAHAIEYSHGVSYIEPLKYGPDFKHFEYVNPNAPQGGKLRIPGRGTYDSFNGILDKGQVPGAKWRLGENNITSDRLLQRAIDEPASYYGRLASGVWVADDWSQFAFKIREGAHWHDGEPLDAEDVVYTFQIMKDSGAAGVRSALYELDTIEQISPDEVMFTTKPGVKGNPDLLFVIAQYPILPKHYWEAEGRDVTKTTIVPPLGSGPYRISEFDLGRSVTLERVENYWGGELPVNKGRYNWQKVHWDYYRDESVELEALKGDVVDVRQETVSKNWMVGYDFPAVNAGYLKKDLVDLGKPWGHWAAVFWNMNLPRFQDIRVREALWLMSEFRYTNRVLMHGFYNYAISYFYNSPMASSGLPSEKELELLEPLRGQIPDRVFTHEFVGNETSGYGFDRDNVKRALGLFKDAGWEIRDGVMTKVDTGQAFIIDFIHNSPFGLRQETPLERMLNMIGIATTSRTLELSNWLYRVRNAQFDATMQTQEPGQIPGIWLRNQFGSQSADSENSQNWGRVRDPAVDKMTEHVMAARTPEDFYAATRAVDRVLLWNFYRIPGLGAPGYRLVYWDKFGRPDEGFRLQREAWIDTWWWDEAKAERTRKGMAGLTATEE